MNYRQIACIVAGLFLAVLPSAFGRKCYVCSTQAGQLGCQDANQISQMYADCSTQQFGGQFGQQAGGMNPQFGVGGGNPQFGGGGSGSFGGGDRCMKITIVGQSQQPQVIRQCGSGAGVVGSYGSDSCSWNGNVQTCICDSNYCNASSKLPASFFLTAFMTFFTALILKSVL